MDQSIPSSGVEIGDQLAFQTRDGVFQQQFALLHPGQLQFVAAECPGQMFDRGIQIAVFDPQFSE